MWGRFKLIRFPDVFFYDFSSAFSQHINLKLSTMSKDTNIIDCSRAATVTGNL